MDSNTKNRGAELRHQGCSNGTHHIVEEFFQLIFHYHPYLSQQRDVKALKKWFKKTQTTSSRKNIVLNLGYLLNDITFFDEKDNP